MVPGHPSRTNTGLQRTLANSALREGKCPPSERRRREAAECQFLDEQRLEPPQPRVVARFGAGDQYILGIGRAQQPPAVRRAYAYAVNIGHLGPGLAQTALDLVDNSEFARLAAREAQLRRIDDSGQAVTQRRQIGGAAPDHAEQ